MGLITTRDLFDRVAADQDGIHVKVDSTVWVLDRGFRSGASYWFYGYDLNVEDAVACDVVAAQIDDPMWELA